ncbi:hypothetical protein BDB00DRAFT_761751 [Zychaea mexicana]|uniref:uncharacterized protein n=1 Tax=Zychaea mexicana TaxID=64656 RepID=UPI0022FE5919|nr:uncharacterized protein BDB00DRAFT_761751 [Zychaea mexicana]KAI9494499.1 hypothetical protein BDB00DRAFT_761751 [Zychaea mexicana]
MSNSAMLTAKKRAEANLRNTNLPTDPQPSSGSDSKSGALLISLLQSRLNWCNSIFPKYRHDNIQQPRRTNNMRKKWPNMRYLGSCTVHLGVHSFPETAFYEAVRTEPWAQLAKDAGFSDEITDIHNSDVDNDNNNKSDNVIDGDGDTIMQEQELAQQQQQQQQGNNCVFTDLVMEFKENTSDRFAFPKEAIVEVTSSCDTSSLFQLTVSFLIPLAAEEENGFFRDPKEKVALWGHQSSSETIRDFSATLDKPKKDNDDVAVVKEEEGGSASASKALPTQQPVNMRLSQVEEPLLNVVRTTVKPAEVVRDRMMARLRTLPTRTFLQYYTAMDKTLALLHKATSFPDVVHGPVTAEKKRNELLNAIQLGKRPRTDEELPKSKSANVKDDGTRKCAYCSAKTTAMWRPGPAGSGTLCNGCGLLWLQGKILKDASVISKEEEKKRAKEERARRQEEQEIERENQRQKELMELQQRQQQQSSKKSTSNSKIGMYAAQLLQQQEQQQAPAEESQHSLPPPPPPPPQPPQLQQQQQQQQPTTTAKAESKPQSSLYSNPAGIPLPTLSIDFGPSFFFVHPACSVALVEGFFSIRLVKEGFPPVVLLMDKKQLQSSTFQVTQESQLREVLVMTVIPTEGPTIHHFNTDLLIPGDKAKSMKIRFLEKLDAGGAVVQRILERWLATPSPAPSAAVAAAAAATITAASAPASSSPPSSS